MTSQENTITVAVHAPNSPDSKRFTWPTNKVVGRAAHEAAQAFGYDPGGTPATFQNAQNRVLDASKTLADENVHQADVLELVSSGGGV